MRQKLPGPDGYPLVVNDIGRVIHPGETFDCELPVPGCVPVDEDGNEITAGAEDEQADSAPQDQPAGKGRAQQKGSRP